MSLEVLSRIQEAEGKAEVIRQNAQHEARYMMKAVEAACAADERSAAVEHRGLYQQMMESKRQSVTKRLQEEQKTQDKQLAEEMHQAKGRLDQAASLIFERVVKHGNR